MTALAVRVGSASSVQSLAARLPLVGRLPVDPAGSDLAFQIATALAVVLVAFVPLYVPQFIARPATDDLAAGCLRCVPSARGTYAISTPVSSSRQNRSTSIVYSRDSSSPPSRRYSPRRKNVHCVAVNSDQCR